MGGVNVTFQRISSTSDLKVGERYIIVYETRKVAMGVISSNKGTEVEITISDNQISFDTSTKAVNIFTLGGEKDAYTLQGSKDSKYVGGNSSTDLVSGTSAADNKYKWKISFTNTGYVSINNVTNSTRYIKHNGSSDWRHYTSSNGNSCHLYKEVNAKSPIGSFSDILAQSVVKGNSIDFNPADYYTNASGVMGLTTLSVTPVTGNIYYSEGKIYATTEAAVASSQTFTLTATPSATDEANYSSVSTTFTVTVHKPSHTATFLVNGNTYNTASVEEDKAITFPDNPANIYGKVFKGWVAVEIVGTTNTAPTYVTSANMGTADVTYYAVFATVTPGNSTKKTDNLTANTFGTSTSYSNWSNKSATSGSDAVYAGNSMTDNDGNIQLRSSDNSGIVSTTSGGKVKKVTVSWDSSTTNGRTLDIYGKTTAYAGSSDLYSSSASTKGTKLGSVVKGTSTELTISGNYTYIGLRSNDKAMYIESISIEWENGTPDTYSDYCTTVSGDVVVPINQYEFSTLYYGDRALVVPAGVKAYTFKVDNSNQLAASTIYDAGETIPMGEAVVIHGAEGNYSFTASSSADAKDDDNVLHGLDIAGTTTGGTVYYKLSLNAAGDANSIGFYWGAASGAAFTSAAHKAYVAVDANLTFGGIETKERGITLLDILGESSGIDDIFEGIKHKAQRTNVYDLQGRKVSKPVHGLYIVNGKKMIVR